MIFYRTFEHGLSQPIDAITSSDGLHAFWLTIVCVGIAVPLNTVFGVITAIVLVRQDFRGKSLINAVIDVPFAISPVVIGLALFLVYAPRNSWFGGWFMDQGVQIIFSVPGMVLATIFVSLPFVVREVMPVLQEIGTDQEEAAKTLGASPWQTFWRVTLPAIRWGVTYGVVLATARALGEFGAVSIVAGNISGQTQTLPLFVKSQFDNIDLAGAYAAAIVLAILAIAVLFSMNLPPEALGEGRRGRRGRSRCCPVRGSSSRSPSKRRPEMAISVKNVTKRFGDFVALDDVSIDVPDGGLTALLGPSGSGKSTLLRVIAGLEQPDTGPGADLGRGQHGDPGAGPKRRLRLPALRRLQAHDRVRQHRLRPARSGARAAARSASGSSS